MRQQAPRPDEHERAHRIDRQIDHQFARVARPRRQIQAVPSP